MNGLYPALEGKVVVITGGTGVLGAAMAQALVDAGARVAVLGRTAAKGEALAAQLRAGGGQAMALAADVLSEPELIRAKDQVLQAWGAVDLLINGAGGNSPQATTAAETYSPENTGFFDLVPEAFGQVFALNFTGTLLPIRVFAPSMVGRPGCSILNVSSMGSFAPMTKVPAYCAAKAAINNFTSWLAVHFAPAGLRVNALAPGFFSTEQNRHLLWDAEGNPTARTRKILDHTPAGRLGKPEDLCGTVLWLCDSTRSGFVTGAVIPVDGGFLAYSGV
jgi:NAD(P)-dependent dehydrogenase (short-subunit alcohol dehydrogenase family)